MPGSCLVIQRNVEIQIHPDPNQTLSFEDLGVDFMAPNQIEPLKATEPSVRIGCGKVAMSMNILGSMIYLFSSQY